MGLLLDTFQLPGGHPLLNILDDFVRVPAPLLVHLGDLVVQARIPLMHLVHFAQVAISLLICREFSRLPLNLLLLLPESIKELGPSVVVSRRVRGL